MMNLDERLVNTRTYQQTRRVPGTHNDQQSIQNNKARPMGFSLFMAACSLLFAGGYVTWDCPPLTVALGTVLFYMFVR
jgi:hypothetical protein